MDVRETTEMIQSDIAETLKQLEELYGVRFTKNRATYDADGTINFNLSCRVDNPDEPYKVEAEKLKGTNRAVLLNKRFTLSEGDFEVVGAALTPSGGFKKMQGQMAMLCYCHKANSKNVKVGKAYFMPVGQIDRALGQRLQG